MTGDQLEEGQLGRFEAAVFEQRRLAHMLRSRGVEIESLQAERERLAARERKEREQTSSLAAERNRLQHELSRATEEHERLTSELSEAAEESDGLREELKRVQYEARRAERRVEKLDHDATEARERARQRLEEAASELSQAAEDRDRAWETARKTVASVESDARELGQTQRDIELLVERERQGQALLAASDRALDEVAGQLLRTRDSRSWRWGHAVSRAMRKITFRRRLERSALDVAIAQLGERTAVGERDERRPA